ncbi:hypothetical protein [Nonomuraea basaltis]|uniref:hypothetical protein n=1 Tax=Nonomuraea basaltis TaxID=2495887 RepID=UPI00110C6410|nr:hypothetical protein [Nonomuraea basaltis]TMR97285.1 hypothetical protein EJK15_18590 [Nonomuraea basaltis]
MKVVFGFGMGVDSAAILVEWLDNPDSRTFDLKDLIVVIAQTGDEWLETGWLIEMFIFPLLRAHGIRTIQVARASNSQRDGIVILDDTTQPTTCYIQGAYRLSDENFEVATVPQTGGIRKCSLKAKGWSLDTLIADITGGEPFVHVIGFEVNELGRMMRDMPLGLPGRIPAYPLTGWGWDRDFCEQLLWKKFQVKWIKSACVQCPYALASTAGLARTLPRYVASPYEAFKPLTMEYLSVAANPRQGLIGGRQLYDALLDVEGGPELLAEFQEHLNCMPWAIYDVRRAFRAKADDMMKPANAARSMTRIATGDRADIVGLLDYMANHHLPPGARYEIGRHQRVWLHERNIYYPCPEQAFVTGPALAIDKTNKTFAEAWEEALKGPSQLSFV